MEYFIAWVKARDVRIPPAICKASVLPPGFFLKWLTRYIPIGNPMITGETDELKPRQTELPGTSGLMPLRILMSRFWEIQVAEQKINNSTKNNRICDIAIGKIKPAFCGKSEFRLKFQLQIFYRII